MAIIPLNSESLDHYAKRFNRLSASTERKWGIMTCHQMLNHVTQLLEVALGERTLPDFSNRFTRSALGRNLMMAIPWPKGRIKAPFKMVADDLASFDDERKLLFEAMGRLAKQVGEDPDRIVVSPILGPITLGFWSRVQGKHLDHHLRQFGV